MAISLPITSRTASDDLDFADVYGNDAQLVTEIDARDDNYQTIMSGGGTYPASNGTVRFFVRAGTATVSLGAAAVGVNNSLALVYFDDADYTIASKTQKLRLRAQQITLGTGPGTTMTVGLYPVSSVLAGVITEGTVVSGSTVAFASTAANTLAQSNSGDFTIPADGYYIVGVTTSGSTAVGSAHDFYWQVQTRWV